MKALVFEGAHAMRYRDEPDPHVAPGEVLVRIEAVGICGSDLHAYHGLDPRRSPPVVLGHEAVGHIASGPEKGRRVALNPLIACGHCRPCVAGRTNLCNARQQFSVHRPGAFAELLAVPRGNLLDIPVGLDSVTAALAEPTAVALHAVNRAQCHLDMDLADIRALVIGGGSIGLLCALLLQKHDAREVCLADTNALRRATAIRAGVREISEPADNGELLRGRFDLVMDAVGTAITRQTAMDAVRPGGVIVHIGLAGAIGGLDCVALTRNEVAFVGTARSTAADLQEAINMLHRGDLATESWLDTWPLAAGSEAFAQIDGGRTSAAKVVLVP